MSDRQEQIDELLDRWEAARDRGETLPAAELCRDHPELLDEIKQAITALAWVPDVPQPEDPQSELISFTGSDGHGGRAFHEPVPKRLGRYELQEPLGAGGFGQVWKAYDTELHRHVAIKVPRTDRGDFPSKIDRFLEEARRVAQLRHPGIVSVFDVGHQDTWCYMVSDLIDGESLQTRIHRQKVPWTEAARIAADVADALQYAHDQGFIHRDVKPANILLDNAGKVYLADFGIAATEQELTTSGSSPSGTLAYMAPEQIQGGPLDGRADVYGLGVALYELLTGTRPFEQKEPVELRQAVVSTAPEPPVRLDRTIPAELSEVCAKALAKEPKRRFGDAKQFAEALRACKAGRRHAGRYVTLATAAVLLAFVSVSLLMHAVPVGNTPVPVAPQTAGTEVEPQADSSDHSENTIGMRFRLIPAGEFSMGSPADDTGSGSDEKPQHLVRITEPFLLGVHEVTRGQFRKFVDATSYEISAKRGGFNLVRGRDEMLKGLEYTWERNMEGQTDQHPVLNVTWKDARAFCGWLSRQEKRTYRLPTEAEWEYACRAGTESVFFFGDDIAAIARYGNICERTANVDFPNWQTLPGRDGHTFPASVGSSRPNPWGIYDMIGNVSEWCYDAYDPVYYASSPIEDPCNDDDEGTLRVRRGGSFLTGAPGECRSAARNKGGRNGLMLDIGFRIVCEVEQGR